MIGQPTARGERVEAMDVARRCIRVLYFIAYPHRMAGANRSLFELISHLPNTVWPVIAVVGEGEVANVYRQAGHEVHVIPPGAALREFGKAMLRWSYARQVRVAIEEYLPYTMKLRRIIHRLDIDLVHVNDPRGAILIGPAARLARRRIVGHLRGEKPFGGLAWQAFETLPDRIITVSKALASSLSARARVKSVTIHNGTYDISGPGRSIPWLDALRAEDVAVVCCFASVVPFKGHSHLLDAAAELNRRGWGDRATTSRGGGTNPGTSSEAWSTDGTIRSRETPRAVIVSQNEPRSLATSSERITTGTPRSSGSNSS